VAEQTRAQKLLNDLQQIVKEKDEQLDNEKKIKEQMEKNMDEMKNELEEMKNKLEEMEKKLVEEKSIRFQLEEELKSQENILVKSEENHVEKLNPIQLNLVKNMYTKKNWKYILILIGVPIICYRIYRN